MASIASPGLGSGLDINSLVSQLVAAEGQGPALRLDTQEARFQTKLSAFGSLKGALADFQTGLSGLKDLTNFQARTALSANQDLFTASALSSATPGSYEIEVLALAQAQKLVSGAFASADTTVGNGTLTLSVGSESFSVSIEAGSDSLTDIRDAINNASDNTGVTARIINSDDGASLVLASDETGTANAITVTTSGGDGGLTSLVYDPDPPGSGVTNLTVAQPAADAVIKIDGLTVTSSINEIAGAIPGTTLNLVAAEVGTKTDLTVSLDKDGVREKIDSFVSSFNKLVDTISNLGSYDADTQATSVLLGDSTLRNISFQIRRELGKSIDGLDGPFSTLAEIGISTNLEGKLEVDSETLDAALESDFDAIGELFSSENGFAVRLDSLVDGYLSTGGVIDSRTTGLKDSIKDIEEQRLALQDRLNAVEARYREQFTALDTLLSQLTSTSSFLAQQLANLPKPGQLVGNN